MRMFQSILLATDFHHTNDAAVDAIIKLATVFESSVTLLNVVEPTHPTVQVTRQQNAEKHLRELSKRLEESKVSVERTIAHVGSPAHTIVNVAQEQSVELIVIGAGEPRGSGAFSAGPVAEAVISHAPQPVLAIRPGDPLPLFKRILCPVDQSKTSLRGLQKAARLANALDSEIFVLSVFPDVSWLTAAAETGVLKNAKIEYLNEWINEFESFMDKASLDAVRWKSELRHGVAHEQIVAVAREQNSDLIIMGATGRTGLVQVLLGSTTRRLLRSLPCSLLTVKQEEVVEELFESDLLSIAKLLTQARSMASTGASLPAAIVYRQILTRDPFHLAAISELAELLDKVGQADEAAKYRRRFSRLTANQNAGAIPL